MVRSREAPKKANSAALTTAPGSREYCSPSLVGLGQVPPPKILVTKSCFLGDGNEGFPPARSHRFIYFFARSRSRDCAGKRFRVRIARLHQAAGGVVSPSARFSAQTHPGRPSRESSSHSPDDGS